MKRFRRCDLERTRTSGAKPFSTPLRTAPRFPRSIPLRWSSKTASWNHGSLSVNRPHHNASHPRKVPHPETEMESRLRAIWPKPVLSSAEASTCSGGQQYRRTATIVPFHVPSPRPLMRESRIDRSDDDFSTSIGPTMFTRVSLPWFTEMTTSRMTSPRVEVHLHVSFLRLRTLTTFFQVDPLFRTWSTISGPYSPSLSNS